MTDQRETIQRAIGQIRREGYKAAALHASVDAVAVFLLANLAARLAAVSIPPVGPLDGSTALAAVFGAAVFATEAAVRSQLYTVEHFEAHNPEVADALRTARDVAVAEDDSPMARRLYDDVLTRLKRTSAAGFVDMRWLSAGLVVVLVLSLATVQVAVAGITLAPPADTTTNGTTNESGGAGVGGGGFVGGDDNGDSRLQDGDSVLGDPKELDRGTDELATNVSAAQGGEEGEGRNEYDDSGFAVDSDPVGASQAGFEADDTLGEADLVREYNLRLRARDSSD